MQVGFLPEIFPQKRSKEISGFLTDISHNFRKSKPITSTQTEVPTGSPPRGGDVAVLVFDINQPSWPTPFYSVIMSVSVLSLNGPFNCILFHEFSQQLSAFSLCSSGLISAVLVLSTSYLFMKVSLSPDKSFVVDWAQSTDKQTEERKKSSGRFGASYA